MNQLLKMEWSLPYALPPPSSSIPAHLEGTLNDPVPASKEAIDAYRDPFVSHCYSLQPGAVRGQPGLCVVLDPKAGFSFSYHAIHYTAAQLTRDFYQQYAQYRHVILSLHHAIG